MEQVFFNVPLSKLEPIFKRWMIEAQSEMKSCQTSNPTSDSKHYVYGIRGLASLFNCSMPTANRIKQSGKIDRAIKQIGRKIVVDADLALELAGRKTGGRR